MSLRCLFAAILSFAFAVADTCPAVSNDGTPAGELKNVSGLQIYHAYPQTISNTSNAILYISDIYGVPLLQNKLLADSLARGTSLPVIMPDLFAGDAIPVSSSEGSLNLTEWRTRHPTPAIDAIINTTLSYMRVDLGLQRIGSVGYCFGGKYVPRWMASGTNGTGIDVGFIAHPSGLERAEIEGVAGPISIAAGELDAAFNTTLRRTAEDVLSAKNATYQTVLYSGAPHGFGVRVDLSNAQQRFAKEGAYRQAVGWLGAWL